MKFEGKPQSPDLERENKYKVLRTFCLSSHGVGLMCGSGGLVSEAAPLRKGAIWGIGQGEGEMEQRQGQQSEGGCS